MPSVSATWAFSLWNVSSSCASLPHAATPSASRAATSRARGRRGVTAGRLQPELRGGLPRSARGDRRATAAFAALLQDRAQPLERVALPPLQGAARERLDDPVGGEVRLGLARHG